MNSVLKLTLHERSYHNSCSVTHETGRKSSPVSYSYMIRRGLSLALLLGSFAWPMVIYCCSLCDHCVRASCSASCQKTESGLCPTLSALKCLIRKKISMTSFSVTSLYPSFKSPSAEQLWHSYPPL